VTVVWSKYQQAIFKEIATGSGNVIVIARAGSSKTTSIVEGCKYLPKGKSAIFCAFNKSIQIELKERLGDWVTSTTLHSMGYKTIKTKYPKIEIDKDKAEKIVTSLVGKSKNNIDIIYNICKTVSLCKATLTDVPSKIESLMEDYSIDFCQLDKKKFLNYVCQTLRKCKEDTKSIDFDDMVWFPFIYAIKPETADFVFIDECQDLNVSQIELALSAVKPGGRVFCVLDDFQSIYGWRGADTEVLKKLRKRLKPKELPLPISYRCPKRIIYLVQKLVPDIQAFSGSPDGEIINIRPEDLQKYTKPGCFVLSRTNAPLISLCMKNIKQGIKANILGRDIGDGLSYMIRKSGKKTISAFLSWLDKWAEDETKMLHKKGKSNFYVTDKVDCLQKLCEGSSTLDEVQSNIKKMFEDETGKDTILYSTIHKSKGMERDDVFVLHDTLRHDTQENKNINYVAFTRAKKRLYLVSRNN
jgi:DNA helicase-2/ATP-dependent DNA helicase PcrA